MGRSGGIARNIFFWTYSRGTIPYDLLCGLILAFVFFVPRSCFAPKKANLNPAGEKPAQSSLLQKSGPLPSNQPQPTK
jgi:hypothetical protein